MIKFLYILFIFLITGFLSCKSNANEKTETFKVWGNCEKCEKTIESSLNVDGVINKDWKVESTLMTVTFDSTIIRLNAIQQLIAKDGYDNDGFYGDDYAYAKLEGCCQYERKPFELK